MIGVQIPATRECTTCANLKFDEHVNSFCGAKGTDADLILCNTRKMFYN